MPRRNNPPSIVSAVLERIREGMHEVMICRNAGGIYDEKWTFPFGPVEGNEAAEAAMRRVLESQLGLRANLQHGQPPFDHLYDQVLYRWRFQFGDAGPSPVNNTHYAEVRWVVRASLREYEFDPVAQQVVDWMLEE